MFDKDNPPPPLPPPGPVGRLGTGLGTGCLANIGIAIVLAIVAPSPSRWNSFIVFVLGPSVVTAALGLLPYRKGESETVKGYAIALAIPVLLSSPCWWTGA
jgi:hypothetical protein